MAFQFTLANQFKLLKSERNARLFSRRAVRSKAWIRLDGGFAVRPCVLVDISDGGAHIRIEAPQSVPEHFTLVLSRAAVSGYRCRIRWRRGQDIGAEFLS